MKIYHPLTLQRFTKRESKQKIVFESTNQRKARLSSLAFALTLLFVVYLLLI